MSRQLAGGFNDGGRQQLTVEQFDILALTSTTITVQQGLTMPNSLLKNTLYANVAAEQMKQYARDEGKKAEIIAQRLENARVFILSEKEKAKVNNDPKLIQLLIQEEIKLQQARKTIAAVSKDLRGVNRQAANIANDVQGLVALTQTSRRAFEKSVDSYVNEVLANASVTLKDGSQLDVALSPKAARDLARYLKDTASVDEIMESRDVKTMIHEEAERLKQQCCDEGESESAVAEKNIMAQVRADFRKQEFTKQLARKQVVVVGALRSALEEQHPHVLRDGNIIKQLTAFANSDRLVNSFVDLMMAEYATEHELAHAARVSDKVVEQVTRSESVLEGLITHLTGMRTTPYPGFSEKKYEPEEAATPARSRPPSAFSAR